MLTVEKLNQRKKKFDIESIIKEELRTIDSKIQQYHDDGECKTIYDLPSTFLTNELDPKSTAIYVYSELIKSCNARGFSVKIQLNDKPRLIISWNNSLGIEEMRNRSHIIQMHII